MAILSLPPWGAGYEKPSGQRKARVVLVLDLVFSLGVSPIFRALRKGLFSPVEFCKVDFKNCFALVLFSLLGLFEEIQARILIGYIFSLSLLNHVPRKTPLTRPRSGKSTNVEQKYFTIQIFATYLFERMKKILH